MLATLGDLVEDVVVRLNGPIRVASDTPALISHRRGGSAANTAAIAARLGYASRFIGQVGDDLLGDMLVSQMASEGVDIGCVRRSGSTGTIVVMVDIDGERSMMTDRRACLELADPDASWLDGVTTLHVPFYSLVVAPLSETSITLIEWAGRRGIAVSIDVSSVALIDSMGADVARELLARIGPTVVFANRDEARALDVTSPLGGALTVVKQGPHPAVVHRPGHAPIEVPAVPLRTAEDTTAAGDAFAAGFLTYDDGLDDTPGWIRAPLAACAAAHGVAADLVSGR